MIYAIETTWADKEGNRWHVMWGDTPDEALAAVYGCGGTHDQYRHMANTLASYDVTPDQFAMLVTLGVKVTDRFGLVYWCAERDGRHELMGRIERARATGCV